MANSPQARKRARQNVKRYAHNKGLRTNVRTEIKKTLKLVAANDKAGANEQMKVTASKIDRIASLNIIHKNKAARLKSRLNQKIKALA